MEEKTLLNRIGDYIENHLYQILIIIISIYMVIYGINHYPNKEEEIIIKKENDEINNFEEDLSILFDYLRENEALKKEMDDQELESLLELLENLYGFSKEYSNKLLDELLK